MLPRARLFPRLLVALLRLPTDEALLRLVALPEVHAHLLKAEEPIDLSCSRTGRSVGRSSLA